MRIDWLLFHVASGHAFFTGAALLVAAVAVSSAASNRRRAAALLAAVGVLAVAVSATPLPWIGYAVWAVALAVWRFAERRREKLLPRRLLAARATAVAACVITVLFEMPHHVGPSIPSRRISAIGVLGDSVTAGMGENEAVTWPNLLAKRYGVVIHDHSAMGATVASARKQAAKLKPGDSLVVIEIGGNDLLGPTTLRGFESGLDALLHDVVRPGRAVVMFELPLPPGFNAFGRVQRRLAAKHGIALIPKRVLMGVLTGPDATLDTIHLSQAGHERMAEAVWKVIGSAFGEPR